MSDVIITRIDCPTCGKPMKWKRMKISGSLVTGTLVCAACGLVREVDSADGLTTGGQESTE